VPKRFELRISVVGEQVFAAEIQSQDSNHTRHDWRRYDSFRTVYRQHTLPDDLHQRCVRLIKLMGLRFGAIDMVFTPDGRYVFLELNPNGQYLWLEEAANLPISDAIVDELPNGAMRSPDASWVRRERWDALSADQREKFAPLVSRLPGGAAEQLRRAGAALAKAQADALEEAMRLARFFVHGSLIEHVVQALAQLAFRCYCGPLL
jgi:hypothetical protein